MTFTNRFNLPPEIVTALTKDRYNPDSEDIGDYSATTLIAPIQQTILKRRHPDRLKEVDVIDRFWAFVGSIAHKVLEEHGTDDACIERRFFATVLGKKISGQVDHYKEGIITDYKSTKSYKIIKGDFEEWEKQLNIYAWLARRQDLVVNQLRIFTFILDWSKNSAYLKNYPKCPIVEIPLKLWTFEEQEEFVVSRVMALLNAELCDDFNLPECSEKERWISETSWVIIKEGSERARKKFSTLAEAETWKLKPGETLTKRLGPPRRCLDHCPASEVCQQNLKSRPEKCIF